LFCIVVFFIYLLLPETAEEFC